MWISGNVPLSMTFLRTIDMRLTKDLLHNLIVRIDISSCPCAFLMVRSLTIFSITSSLKQNEESLAVETYCRELGTVLLFKRGVDFEAKETVKIVCSNFEV